MAGYIETVYKWAITCNRHSGDSVYKILPSVVIGTPQRGHSSANKDYKQTVVTAIIIIIKQIRFVHQLGHGTCGTGNW